MIGFNDFGLSGGTRNRFVTLNLPGATSVIVVLTGYGRTYGQNYGQ